MWQTPTSHAAGVDALLLSPYALDRLLRLRLMLNQQRAAEQMLHGSALADARALLPQAIFSLYLDCVEAGVAEDARRILGTVPRTTPAPVIADPITCPDSHSLTSGRPA
jgi:hypothetical protein